MKRLTLMRHAKSSWRDARLDDHDRPLNKRGLKSAPLMGDALVRRLGVPDLVLCSTAKRTRQTLELLGGWATKTATRFEPALYLADPAVILALVHGADPAAHVLIIGHNPGLESVVATLAPKGGVAEHGLPTAAIASFDADGDHWAGIGAADLRLSWFKRPADLPGAEDDDDD